MVGDQDAEATSEEDEVARKDVNDSTTRWEPVPGRDKGATAGLGGEGYKVGDDDRTTATTM